MDHTIIHFEIPADDVEKLKKFYSELFGWKMIKSPGFEEMDYNLIETVPVDEKGFPIRQGVNGGLFKKMGPWMKPTYYISVESVEEYGKKIERLGGKITQPKIEVPGVGYVIQALDPEGNSFAMFEAMTPK
jgi:predicted enzyme related to lactoylglutathione lyase